MAGFANSFWSQDYAGGLGVLFSKLQQGVQENQQVLTVARMRADAEDLYGQKLADISLASERLTGGFSRDDGASVRKAYEGIRSGMEESAKNHKKIASNIRELVVNPFGRWCDDHAARVQNSQDDLQARVKVLDKQAEVVRKFRSQYYNKCRLVEDLEEEDKLAFKSPDEKEKEVPTSPKAANAPPIPTIKEPEPEDEPEPIDIGDNMYMPDQVKMLLTHMLENIKLGEQKVPILGTYQNVASGAAITEYVQKYMEVQNISAAEKLGQDLVDHGFLRLIGNVGSTFANSTKMSYQFKPKVFQITGIPEKKPQLGGRVASLGLSDNVADSPVGAVSEYLSGWNPLNTAYPNETAGDRLRREAKESDDRYKASVRKLDALRCNLEEAMFDHLKFMERCELDRLKAIKSVVLDFSGAISNCIPSLQSTVDSMMLFQETVQPIGDLRYLLENYRTGPFMPKVTVYENYYNNVDGQTFGVDLEARARADRKRVPLVVTSILTYLDDHYPDLDGDEARRAIWLVDVPLAASHHLRASINNGEPIPHDLLSKYEIPIIASVLKLYMLELPDSLVSSHVYEIIKTIYSSTVETASDEARVNVIQNTLGQLRLANIATLDAITTHFTRLIELTSADETYVASLSTALAPCILRPRQETTLTMNERYNYRLLRDLFAHKDAIFGELKRASSQANRAAAARPADDRGRRGRGTSMSTDESNRQKAEQERRDAISERTRDKSPAPASRSIRRERSPNRLSGGPGTRFPVAPSPMGSPTSGGGHHRSNFSRHSLEVPGGVDGLPMDLSSFAGTPAGIEQRTNGSPEEASADGGIAKRDSLSRVGRVAGRTGRSGTLEGGDAGGGRGVELTDRPMDD